MFFINVKNNHSIPIKIYHAKSMKQIRNFLVRQINVSVTNYFKYSFYMVLDSVSDKDFLLDRRYLQKKFLKEIFCRKNIIELYETNRKLFIRDSKLPVLFSRQLWLELELIFLNLFFNNLYAYIYFFSVLCTLIFFDFNSYSSKIIHSRLEVRHLLYKGNSYSR